MTSPPADTPRAPAGRGRVWAFRLFLVLALAAILIVARLGLVFGSAGAPADPTLIALATQLAVPATASATSGVPASAAPLPTRTTLSGMLLYSARTDAHSHLLAIAQGDPAPTQLTDGNFDDREPAISPDGSRVAFASNRQGGWDLYLLDLATGEIRQLTATEAFEGDPTWSPDGLWLAYESYAGEDFDIWVLRLDGSEPPIQLTDAPSSDTSPTWHPAGRRVAFVSDRDGLPDIFAANLDDPDERYLNLTRTAFVAEADPEYSSDGSSIAYSGRGNGLDFVYVAASDGSSEPREVGLGRSPAWSPNRDAIGAVLPSAQTSHFVLYPLVETEVNSIGFPAVRGVVDLTWSPGAPPTGLAWLPAIVSAEAAGPTASAGRVTLARLPGVDAPTAMLSDTVDEAFLALRSRAAEDVGWDVLGTLEHAFVGINAPLPPGFAYNDWLYTGRAFALDSRALASGLLEVVREDYGAETYWRVYVKTSPQDGSVGEPLRVRSWDFATRYTGDPTTYDRGGSLKAALPQGYYVDLTQLAADFGFERVPAMSNWRTYFQGARYNEFARTDGMSWLQAMLQIYPPEAIVTPTPYRTPTPTATRTPIPTLTPWWWPWVLTATANAQATVAPSVTPSP